MQDAEGTASELQDRVIAHVEQQGHLGSAARHCELAARLATHLRRHPRQRQTSLLSMGSLRLFEEGGLRLVAVRGDPSLVSQCSHHSQCSTRRVFWVDWPQAGYPPTSQT
jgi:hypothetical protein